MLIFTYADAYKPQRYVSDICWCLRAHESRGAMSHRATVVSYCGERARRDRWEVDGGSLFLSPLSTEKRCWI